MSSFVPEISNNIIYSNHGGFDLLGAANHNLTNAAPLTRSKGIGKILLDISTVTVTGTITITGDTVDRETGAVSIGDNEVIVITTPTTNSPLADGNGNPIHNITNAYLTSKWFTGSVTITMAGAGDVVASMYHVSYEQFNDEPNIVIDTIDINIQETSSSARLGVHTYTVEAYAPNRCDIKSITRTLTLDDIELTVAPVVNEYYRLRRGNLNYPLNGTTDGIFVECFMAGTTGPHANFGLKVWARILPEV
jgi:hypothetical protein